MSLPPPGWYPDATHAGLQRWWDGRAWSAVTRQAPGTVAPAGSWPPPAGSEPATPWGAGTPPWAQAPQQAGSGPWTAGPTTDDGEPLAGLGVRLVARVLDWLLVGLVTALLLLPWAGRYSAEQQRVVDAFADPDSTFTELQTAMNDLTSAMLVPATATYLLVSVVYVVGFLTTRGATPGKLLFGLRVRRADRPARPTTGQALLRWVGFDVLVYFCSFLWLVVDGIAGLADRQRRTVHDRMAGTVVTRRR